jgi:uncharacterized protein YndB with AHSA1/START domain
MTTPTPTAPATASPSNEIRITRLYDAPVSAVWDAWTDPAQVGQWWGPRGFSITTHHRELRVGGTWEYTMHGPDGKDWPNFTTYHVVEPQAKLVYDHGASSADAKPMFRVTATFRAVHDKTELDLRMVLATAEEAQAARVFIKAAGGNATWDRLAEHLEQTASGSDIFVINRGFAAPLETMFDMWTTPEHFAQWLPPTGFTMRFERADIRTGGDAFYAMTNGQFTMYGRVEYVEIRRPDRLEYRQCFTDAQGALSRHPGAPVWPEYMRTVVSLTDEGDGNTRVKVRWAPDGNATREEIAAFVEGRSGMTLGWTGSFDKLDAALGAAGGW